MVPVLICIQHQLAPKRLILRRPLRRRLARNRPLGIIKPNRDLGQRIRTPPLEGLQIRQLGRQIRNRDRPLERPNSSLGHPDALSVPRHALDAPGREDLQLGRLARLEIARQRHGRAFDRRVAHEVRPECPYGTCPRAELVYSVAARAAHPRRPDSGSEPRLVGYPHRGLSKLDEREAGGGCAGDDCCAVCNASSDTGGGGCDARAVGRDDGLDSLVLCIEYDVIYAVDCRPRCNLSQSNQPHPRPTPC
jgi:hypothetical protein